MGSRNSRMFFAAALAAVLSLWQTTTRAQLQQAPPVQWERSYGGSGDDAAECIRPTTDGGYILAGLSTSNNDGDVTGHHHIDYSDDWIVKIDQAGAIQWERCYGGGGDICAAYSIEQTKDGGYIVAGVASGNGGDVTGYHVSNDSTLVNRPEDCWILKLDAAGNIQWEHCYGGSGDDVANSIQQTADGGYVFAGYSSSHDGDVMGHAPDNYDNEWIVKLDAFGNIQWSKCYGSGNQYVANSIEQTRDGGYIVAGNTPRSGYLILKLDGSGGYRWAKTYGGSGGDDPTSIRQTKDGGYIVGGYSGSNDGDVTGHHFGIDSTTDNPTSDYWIVKLDSLGALQWEKSLGGSGEDEPYETQQMSDGGYIVAGWSVSTDGDVTGHHPDKPQPQNDEGNYGGNDYWIVKLDGAGNIQWEQCYGGSQEDDAYSIVQTSDGGCIAAGISFSNDGDVTGNHLSDSVRGITSADVWVVKLPPTAPEIFSANQSALRLLCTTTQNDTVWVRNVGMKTLAINSASLNSASPAYTFLSPTTFPDSIVPGDSVACVVRFFPSGAGTFADTLVLTDNDTITGHNPWKIAFTGRKDSVGFSIWNVRNDTLDFGELACGAGKDTTFDIYSLSTVPTTFFFRTDSTLFVVPPSVHVDSIVSDGPFPPQKEIRAHFVGSVAAGVYIAPMAMTDTCGETKTLYLKAKVDSSSFMITALPDTTVCPGSSFTRNVNVRNTSRVAQNVDLSPTGDANDFSLSSTQFTLAPGDSAILQLTFTGGMGSGTYAVNYPLPGCNGAQAVTETVHIDSIRLASLPLRDTTICPGDSAVRYITIRNLRDQVQSAQVVLTDTLFSVAPDSLMLGANDSSKVRIVFHGTPKIGSDTMVYMLVDACNDSYAYTMIVNVSAAEVQAQAIADTTICPGDSAVRHITLRNVSSITQQLTFRDSLPFTFSLDTLMLAEGDSAVVEVTFHGAADTGVYIEHYALSGCGGGNTLTAIVRVGYPNITVSRFFAQTICPMASTTIHIPVTNSDTLARVLTFTDSNCTLLQTTATLAAGATDTLAATFAGGAVGTYTCIVHVADDCGGVHVVTLTISVQSLPPLALALVPDATPVKVGGEVKIYVTATPPSSVAGTLSFTVGNDAQILRFDSVHTSCGSISKTSPGSTVITLGNCPALASDTIATLYYEALVGPTLTTSAEIVTAATTNACQTVSASGAAMLTLLPPSCDIGTIGIEPQATSLGAVYPNPATGAVTVAYTMVEDAPVRIALADALGRTVEILVDGWQKHGSYLAEFDAHGLPNGAYVITMQEGLYKGAREMFVIK